MIRLHHFSHIPAVYTLFGASKNCYLLELARGLGRRVFLSFVLMISQRWPRTVRTYNLAGGQACGWQPAASRAGPKEGWAGLWK